MLVVTPFCAEMFAHDEPERAQCQEEDRERQNRPIAGAEFLSGGERGNCWRRHGAQSIAKTGLGARIWGLDRERVRGEK